MTRTLQLPRNLIIFGIVLPLAALLGYLLASPLEFDSLVAVGLILGCLFLPVFLRWHHPILVLAWNATVTVFFLPGNPFLWMLVGGLSLGVSIVNRVLNKESRLLHVPSVAWTLIALALVVIATAQASGGFGLRSFGGNIHGGKKYFFILFAILGYFALSCQRVAPEKAGLYSGLYFLSGLSGVLSNLIYLAGPSLYILFLFFSVDLAVGQAMEDMQWGVTARFSRIIGATGAGLAAFSFLLSRCGIRGILDLTKPWRALTCLALFALSLLGGFRSSLIIFSLLFAAQFYFEGLHRTRLLPIVLVMALLGVACLIPLAKKLPLSVQRSLSVLPIGIDAAARADAKYSTQWRLRMWEVLLAEIPKYLWLGKGYTASAADFYLAMESQKRGFSQDFETSLIAGDYHNGPLSILIPFGVWGLIAFLAFVVAAWRVLYSNYRFGDPALAFLNTFLLSAFAARIVFFLTVFGAVHSDLPGLIGLVALSISLNGGVSKAPVLAAKPAQEVSLPPLSRWKPSLGHVSRR